SPTSGGCTPRCRPWNRNSKKPREAGQEAVPAAAVAAVPVVAVAAAVAAAEAARPKAEAAAGRRPGLIGPGRRRRDRAARRSLVPGLLAALHPPTLPDCGGRRPRRTINAWAGLASPPCSAPEPATGFAMFGRD